MTTKFYLDCRWTKEGGRGIVKVAVLHKSVTTYFPTGVKVFPRNWDKQNERIIRVADREELNNIIRQKKLVIDSLIQKYVADRIHFDDVYQLRERILSDLEPERNADSFATHFKEFAMSKTNPKTQSMYLFTLKRMGDYDKKLEERKFEDITKSWLTGFENHLELTSNSKNGRNIHLRNIRAVFNSAIDNNITTFYPFRTLKIRPVPTRKRALTVEGLRALMNYPVEKYQKRYVDLFMLDFFLIGINFVDLCFADEIIDGRLEYVRAKTKRPYSIKVEPEAQEIIDRYRGEKHLLSILDDNGNYQDFLQRMNKNLKRIGKVEYHEYGRKTITPVFPELSTYWARHTWATIAASLDIPKETIAHALGHDNNTVTDIYIDFDMKKVDEANRKVIDWVLYNK